jgi:fatty-acid peroxygenase
MSRVSAPVAIPTLPALDSSLALLSDGYMFGTRRFLRVGTDAFHTRLMLRAVTVVRGSDAARMFYDGNRFTRNGALPVSVLHLLQDEGSVQTLDDESHRRRKMLFVHMLAEPGEMRRVRDLLSEEWFSAIAGWSSPVNLHEEMHVILTRVALRWLGIDSRQTDVPTLAGELSAMIENAGRFGVPNWVARVRRLHTETWAREIVRRVRRGELAAPAHSPLMQLVTHADENDALGDADAATELLNLLRPIVAVGRFIVFSALALHRNPRWKHAFSTDDGAGAADVENFVNEVRRFYPFFPLVGGRALHAFTWRDHDFLPGDWVMLDLYGTNHDESTWSAAGRFLPERFRTWNGDPNSLVPQGGGSDLSQSHRCPGERLTIELMCEAVILLARGTRYDVPDQDLRVSLRRIPALPESGFVIARAAPSGLVPH